MENWGGRNRGLGNWLKIVFGRVGRKIWFFKIEGLFVGGDGFVELKKDEGE